MKLLCCDIGNTSMTYGMLKDGEVLETGKIATKSLNDPTVGFQSILSKYTKDAFDAISFCSVVPNAKLPT